MRAFYSSKRKNQAGFSLIEVIAALVVVGIGMPAVAYMYTTAIIVDSDSTSRTQGIYLANSLMNEISQRRYKESAGFPGNGAEFGEVTGGSYSRINLDDIDDYQQFAATGGWGRLSPPCNELGVAITEFPGYSQYVSVENLSPPTTLGVLSLTPVSQGTTDIKLVKVELKWAANHQTVTVSKIFTIP